MVKMQCDRCGKYYDVTEDGKTTRNAVQLFFHNIYCDVYEDVGTEKAHDLCPDCVKDFDRWFKKAN